MQPIELAKRYFELSNASSLDEIRQLMTAGTTYSSQNTGLFLGVDEIMAMQTRAHRSFESLAWNLNSVEEIKPGIVRFDFEFHGKTRDGESIRRAGIEYVIVHEGKIQHIEVRNK